MQKHLLLVRGGSLLRRDAGAVQQVLEFRSRLARCPVRGHPSAVVTYPSLLVENHLPFSAAIDPDRSMAGVREHRRL